MTPKERQFKVIWHNEHASGELSGGPFETEEQAEQFGEDWLREMVALDDDPAEAEDAYSFEIVEDPLTTILPPVLGV